MPTQPTVIFDLDGTLADIEHRRVFLANDRPDWARFNAAMRTRQTPPLSISTVRFGLAASMIYKS